VLLTTAIVAGVAVFLSSRQEALYEASARVLLTHQNLASGLAGIPDLTGVDADPVRDSQTQTQVAMSPAVAERVVRRAGVPGLDASSFLEHASVTPDPDSDILNFEVTYSDPATAARLATIHAESFVAHRQDLDTAALVAARKELHARIEELQAGDFRGSDLVANLVETEQQLRTMEALQTSNASLLRAAAGATQVQPKLLRNAVLGAVLGLMLGIGLVFALDALDTRIRSSSEIADRLELPLLARLAAPPRRNRRRNRLVMLSEPQGPRAEAFRMLRSNLDFANLDRGARSIIVTSALEREGKSTTVANLAVALARAGQRVALVDLDLRKPLLAKFFGIDRSQPGVTSVVLGRSTPEQAMVEVFRTSSGSDGRDASAGGSDAAGGGMGLRGSLRVLVAGPSPPDPGEFVSSPKLGDLLRELSEMYDLVLIDTPPVLVVGDTSVISRNADAMVVVANLKLLKRPVVQELARALATCPTVKLGFVATGAEADEVFDHWAYNYDYAGRDDDAAWSHSYDSGTGERVA
jgi:succinoglycan biosynthesis transport protein ExoP